MTISSRSKPEQNRENANSSKEENNHSVNVPDSLPILKKIQKKFRINSFDESFFNLSVVPKVILDADFNIFLVNKAFSEVARKPQTFFEDKNFLKLFPDKQVHEVFSEALSKQLPDVIYEKSLNPLLKDNNRNLFWDWVIQPFTVVDEAGKYILLSLLQTTNQHQTKRVMDNLLDRMETILGSIHDGVYIVNKNYEIEYANDVFIKDFGEIADQPCYQYLHQRDQICPNCDMAKVLAGEIVSFEQIYPRIGKIYDVMDIPLKNLDGSTSKFRLMHDITRLKNTENELLQANIAMREKTNEERRHRDFAEALVNTSNDLNKSMDITVVLSRMMEHIKNGIRFSFGSIMILNKNDHNFEQKHFISLNEDQQIDVKNQFPIEEIFNTQKLFSLKEPVLVEDTCIISNWKVKNDWKWVRSILSVPILVNDKVEGLIILLDENPASFTTDVLKRMTAFASQASIAIQNAALFEKIRERNKHLQLLSQHQTKILEEERQYIARELHDEAGQSLTKLILDVHLLENQIDNPGTLREKISEIEDSLVEISKNLHRVAMALRPASLDHLGLTAAINQFVDTINQSNKIKIHVEDEGVKERLPKDVETIVYRIVQESLTNVIRHAQAEEAWVRISAENHTLRIVISDNGVGFNPALSTDPTHLGLLGMRERVQMVNGQIFVDSAPNQGTRIIVEVDYGD